ncbi:MAG: hypothetical protein HY656_01495 [Acidobacteria bacterium]|nr:hypothetical protein [Acidobacteriota bacterium]
MNVTEQQPLDYLRFRDWLASGREMGDWITVAQSDDSSHGDFHMGSGILRRTKKNLTSVLKSPEWGPIHPSGYPAFLGLYGGRPVYSPDGSTPDYPVKAFIIRRNFHGIYPARFDVLQEFLLYHNLYEREQELIDPVTEEVVIRLSPNRVLVRAHQLKDFLAARKAVLVRFHDHRRQIVGKHEALSGQWKPKIDESNFLVSVSTVPGLQGPRTVGRILGKDLLHGYSKPAHPDSRSSNDEKREYAEFVVGRDPQSGDPKLLPCSGQEFLTPVFFELRVLKKYYDNPRRYTVEPGYIRDLHFWGISYGINNEGYVHVWLGDLGHLPHEEQLHWKAHNAAPVGKLSGEFWATQMQAQFVDLERIEHKITRLRSDINEQFKAKHGFPLFLDLDPRQVDILKTLHQPVTNEQQELNDQLLNLCKLLQDSIAVKKLTQLVKDRSTLCDEKGQPVPPLSVLDLFLGEQFAGKHDSTAIVKPLRLLQQLRSSGGAVHRIDPQELQRVMNQLGLYGSATTGEVFQAIASRVNVALSELNRLLSDT